MGNWSMHIEGHGIHDNGLETDAESMMREFVGQLALDGHFVQSATFTVGSTREIPVSETGRIEAPPGDYRFRS